MLWEVLNFLPEKPMSFTKLSFMDHSSKWENGAFIKFYKASDQYRDVSISHFKFCINRQSNVG
jgi:hypothetical protein